MPQRRHVMRAALTAAAATACLAFAAPAWAGASLTGNPHNPPGDNGTVKIDGAPFEDKVDNQPHVTCDFELEFFNFDEGQKANITLWAQPPSSSPKDKVVWSVKNYVISNDPAAGAQNDHDEVIRLSAKDLDLAGLKLQEQQGYHIKLDVDLTDGKAFDDKHKVFWLKPCESPSPTPSNPGEESPTPNPGQSGGSSENPSSAGGGSGGGSGTEGGLPLTGVAATSTALTGLALIGGGVALMVLRRRRDKITFTS
ncbi:LPXTG cell wall anchor domain-containing protein [Micromonospora sp. RTP1Z1]|uniref:LPXTG cell wall anchor domain-containing protein n=1 Tax=Micromonospora sp. RTP1Z1 TaxID=2994043 RepID=UPI0029C70097|nr:LPXTG cell wall anchor domain-containing protein [Micromonospora sp. RTP1Z1]